MKASIEEMYEPIRAFVKGRVSDEHLAEDITQEVFYKLIRSNPTDVTDLRSWLYAIARNSITDHYRKKKLPLTNLEGVEIAADTPSDEVVRCLSTCLTKYIELLPADYQDIMRLSEIEHISQKEIAAQLQMNYATVRSRVQRGRVLLRDLFTQCCSVVQGGRGSIMDYTEHNPHFIQC